MTTAKSLKFAAHTIRPGRRELLSFSPGFVGWNNVSVSGAGAGVRSWRCEGTLASRHVDGGSSGDGARGDAQKPTEQSATASSTASKEAKNPPQSPEVVVKRKTQAQLDEELRLKLEGISGEGGGAGVEYEGGKAVGLKRGVRENMFRVI